MALPADIPDYDSVSPVEIPKKPEISEIEGDFIGRTVSDLRVIKGAGIPRPDAREGAQDPKILEDRKFRKLALKDFLDSQQVFSKDLRETVKQIAQKYPEPTPEKPEPSIVLETVLDLVQKTPIEEHKFLQIILSSFIKDIEKSPDLEGDYKILLTLLRKQASDSPLGYKKSLTGLASLFKEDKSFYIKILYVIVKSPPFLTEFFDKLPSSDKIVDFFDKSYKEDAQLVQIWERGKANIKERDLPLPLTWKDVHFSIQCKACNFQLNLDQMVKLDKMLGKLHAADKDLAEKVGAEWMASLFTCEHKDKILLVFQYLSNPELSVETRDAFFELIDKTDDEGILKFIELMEKNKPYFLLMIKYRMQFPAPYNGKITNLVSGTLDVKNIPNHLLQICYASCQQKLGQSFKIFEKWMYSLDPPQEEPDDFKQFLWKSKYRQTILNVMEVVIHSKPEDGIRFLNFAAEQRENLPGILDFMNEQPSKCFATVLNIWENCLEAEKPRIKVAFSKIFNDPQIIQAKDLEVLLGSAQSPRVQTFKKLILKNDQIIEIIPFLGILKDDIDRILGIIEQHQEGLPHVLGILKRLEAGESINLPNIYALFAQDASLCLSILEMCSHFPYLLNYLIEISLLPPGRDPNDWSSLTKQIVDFCRSQPIESQKKWLLHFMRLISMGKVDFTIQLLSLYKSRDGLEFYANCLYELALFGDRGYASVIMEKISKARKENKPLDPWMLKLLEMGKKGNLNWLRHLVILDDLANPQKESPKMTVLKQPVLENYAMNPESPFVAMPKTAKADPLAKKLLERIGADQSPMGISKKMQNIIEAFISDKGDDKKRKIINDLLTMNWEAPKNRQEEFILKCLEEGNFTLIYQLLDQTESSKIMTEILNRDLSPKVRECLTPTFFEELLEMKGNLTPANLDKVITYCIKAAAQLADKKKFDAMMARLLFLMEHRPSDFQKIIANEDYKEEVWRKVDKQILNQIFSEYEKEFPAEDKRFANNKRQGLMIKTTWLARQLSRFLVMENGYINGALIPIISERYFQLLPIYAKSEMQSLLEKLQDPGFNAQLREAKKPRQVPSICSKSIQQFFELDPTAKITDRHARMFIVSSLLSTIVQTDVGSCFGTAAVKKTKWMEPSLFVLDAISLIRDGSISRYDTFYPAAVYDETEKFEGFFISNPLCRIMEHTVAFLSEEGTGDFVKRKMLPVLSEPLKQYQQADSPYHEAASLLEKGLLSAMDQLRWRYDPRRVEKGEGAEKGSWILQDSEGEAIETMERYQQIFIKMLASVQNIDLLGRGPPEDKNCQRLIDLLSKYIYNEGKGGFIPSAIEALSIGEGDKNAKKMTPWYIERGGYTDRVFRYYYQMDDVPVFEKIIGKETTLQMESFLESLENLPPSLQTGPLISVYNNVHAFNCIPTHPSLERVKKPEARKKWIEDRVKYARDHFAELAPPVLTAIFGDQAKDVEKVAQRAANPAKALMTEAALVCGSVLDERVKRTGKEMDLSIWRSEKIDNTVRAFNLNYLEGSNQEVGWEYSCSGECFLPFTYYDEGFATKQLVEDYLKNLSMLFVKT